MREGGERHGREFYMVSGDARFWGGLAVLGMGSGGRGHH